MADDTDPTPKQRILIVDDNEANRVLAANTLEDEGYVVELAASGAEALVAFEKSPPDCIVLDVRMPDLDGFAVCERIRQAEVGATTPIIFLTALRDIETFDRVLRVGGDDFLTKPVRPTELVVRVQTALKVRRLGTELDEHFKLLRQQRDSVMRLQLQKERLMAFLVHDLKNPVNSMDLHAQLVLRDKALLEPARRSVSQIRTEARQLSRMILNLLDLSKGDEGKLSPHKSVIPLGPLVHDVLDELEMQAQARNIRLVANLQAAEVVADHDLLRRTLANLLDNAIRHAPHGTRVTIESLTSEGHVELTVSDEGDGVPDALRESVFDAFVRLDVESSSRDATGRGLGLAFCKLSATAHGGTIVVEDANPGARFRMRLPNARRAVEEQP